jgi:hypothetical protein
MIHNRDIMVRRKNGNVTSGFFNQFGRGKNMPQCHLSDKRLSDLAEFGAGFKLPTM